MSSIILTSIYPDHRSVNWFTIKLKYVHLIMILILSNNSHTLTLMEELVDSIDSKSVALWRVGSNPTKGMRYFNVWVS